MNYLITTEDFKAYRQITDNQLASKIDPYIKEAQFIDLREALGDALYYDLVNNSGNSIYQTLIDGSTYVDTQGYTVSHEGLKPVLVYFAYARYIENSGSHDSAYGQVTKRNEHSDPISEKTLARKVTNARSTAKAYLNDVIKYLNVNFEDYPLWRVSCSPSGGDPSGGIKITAVGDDCDNGNYSRFNPPNNYYPDISW